MTNDAVKALPGQSPAAALERIRPFIRHTPLHPSPWLSERAGVPVYLKLECWQITLSFKARGACNAVAGLDNESRARGLVTASAGNHGLGLAFAAATHGAAATIFVPAGAPEAKRGRIRRLGASLIEVEGSYDDAAAAAHAWAVERDLVLVHPFNDPDVVTGQGTVAVEILQDLPDVRHVVVPVGGGGLVAGVGAALEEGGSAAGVVGVQSVRTRAMHEALAAGRVVRTAVEPTLCDGLAGETEPESYERVRRVVDQVLLVEERTVAAAIRGLFRDEGLVVEGAGAVGVAALLEGAAELTGPTAIILTGGNLDMEVLASILEGP